jgi:hypothetical protein
VGHASGFDAFQLADPLLLADINGNGRLDSTDATRILQEAVGFNRPEIPDRPAGITIPAPAGPDPLLYLSKTFVAAPGETVTVPVRLDRSVELHAVDLALSYDGRRLEFVSAARGSLTADFDLLLVNHDPAAGTLRLGLSRSLGSIDDRGSGSVVLLTFRIQDNAPAGRALINLRERVEQTATALNEGGLDLNPAPSDRAGDVLDGAITVLRPRRLAHAVRDLVFARRELLPRETVDVVSALLAAIGSRSATRRSTAD